MQPHSINLTGQHRMGADRADIDDTAIEGDFGIVENRCPGCKLDPVGTFEAIADILAGETARHTMITPPTTFTARAPF